VFTSDQKRPYFFQYQTPPKLSFQLLLKVYSGISDCEHSKEQRYSYCPYTDCWLTGHFVPGSPLVRFWRGWSLLRLNGNSHHPLVFFIIVALHRPRQIFSISHLNKYLVEFCFDSSHRRYISLQMFLLSCLRFHF
jgi:hypothetical protein